jgi:hypothetical protein
MIAMQTIAYRRGTACAKPETLKSTVKARSELSMTEQTSINVATFHFLEE